MISLGYRLFGVHVKLALLLNVVFATATVLLLYVVALRVMGRRAAIVAGATFAILPGPLVFAGLVMSESAFGFIIAGFLALAVFLPERAWKPAALGVALGLAALTRGEGLLMPIIPLAMWWGHVPRGASRAARRSCWACMVADRRALDDPQRDRDGRLHPGGVNNAS